MSNDNYIIECVQEQIRMSFSRILNSSEKIHFASKTNKMKKIMKNKRLGIIERR